MTLTTIGFDADDTLWHTERIFRLTQERFARLLADHVPPERLERRLVEAERRNLGRYGFGVKAFVLSMIETALDVTRDTVPPAVIRELIETGHAMLEAPIELMPGAAEAVEALGRDFRLVLITKGDLLDQERKLAQSGLGERFHAVEIVSDKSESTYVRAFARHGDGAARALMVGDSVRSDMLPALAAGAHAVHVPQPAPWELERADLPQDHPRFHSLPDLAGLPAFVGDLMRAEATGSRPRPARRRLARRLNP